MSAQKVLGLICGLMLAAGLVAGFVPVSSQGANCGSAFHKSDDADVSDLTNTMTGYGSTSAADSCDSLRSVVRIPALALIGVGLVLGLAALVVAEGVSRKRVDVVVPDAEPDR